MQPSRRPARDCSEQLAAKPPSVLHQLHIINFAHQPRRSASRRIDARAGVRIQPRIGRMPAVPTGKIICTRAAGEGLP